VPTGHQRGDAGQARQAGLKRRHTQRELHVLGGEQIDPVLDECADDVHPDRSAEDA
jgi:hypothetical protein